MSKRVTVGRDHIQVKTKFKYDDALMLEYAAGLAGADIVKLVHQAAIAAAKMVIWESEIKKKGGEDSPPNGSSTPVLGEQERSNDEA